MFSQEWLLVIAIYFLFIQQISYGHMKSVTGTRILSLF